jgi:hypothetical protein
MNVKIYFNWSRLNYSKDGSLIGELLKCVVTCNLGKDHEYLKINFQSKVWKTAKGSF